MGRGKKEENSENNGLAEPHRPQKKAVNRARTHLLSPEGKAGGEAKGKMLIIVSATAKDGC